MSRSVAPGLPAETATVFAHRSFGRLWGAGLLSYMACWMSMVAASWLMTQIDPRPVMVALVQAASTLPFFLLSMPAGVLADLTDRRAILLSAQGGNLLASAALAALALAGALTPAALVLATFALGAMQALYVPAAQTTVADVVPREQMQQAVAFNSVSFNLARTLGPGLAGAFLVAGATAWLFMVNAMAYAVAFVALWSLPRPGSSGSGLPPERPWAALRAGLRYARYAPAVQAVIWRSTGFTLTGSALWALLPLLSGEAGGKGASAYGLRMASLGIGAVCGALLVSRVRRSFSHETIFTASTALFAVATAACALLSTSGATSWIVLAVLVGAGIAWMLGNSLLFTLAQTNVPAWVRARTAALLLVVFQGGMALGAVAWGFVATQASVASALLAAALLTLPSLWLRRRMPLVHGDASEVTLLDAESGVVLADRSDPGAERRAGQVAIEIRYRVAPAEQPAFVELMQGAGRARLRDGALFWRLFQAGEDKCLFVERVIADSWLEYERQQARQTVAQRQLMSRVQRLLEQGTAPVTTHFEAVR